MVKIVCRKSPVNTHQLIIWCNAYNSKSIHQNKQDGHGTRLKGSRDDTFHSSKRAHYLQKNHLQEVAPDNLMLYFIDYVHNRINISHKPGFLPVLTNDRNF